MPAKTWLWNVGYALLYSVMLNCCVYCFARCLIELKHDDLHENMGFHVDVL